MLSSKRLCGLLFTILISLILISIGSCFLVLYGLTNTSTSLVCSADSSTSAGISTSNHRQTLVAFTNITTSVGLSGVSGNFFAWGDYNNDGNQDILINGGRLFKNSGGSDYKFTEVTDDLGLDGSGKAAWADYDNDGDLDFYSAGYDVLWRNEGPPTYNFKDVTEDAGIGDNWAEYPTTAVGWGDYNLDGYLDMYITGGEDWNDGDPIYYPDYLFHNNGDGTFTDITERAGIREFGGPYYGRGVAWGDYDNDGWPDIYISNYRISQNWLFHNNRNGTFTDVALEKGVAGEEAQRMGNIYYGHTVGSAWADLDNDGDLDLFESDLAHKDLYRGPICGDSQIYRNNGAANNYDFTDVRPDSGIPEKNIGAGEDELFVGIAMGDFDNDGFLDLFIPQIYDLEYSYSYLYHSNGDWTFSNVSDDVGVLVWNTYGGAWCDYNNDGFLDLITGGKGSADPNATSEVHLYKNGCNTNSWLHIKLIGKHYNKMGIGVRVKVTADGTTQIRELEGGMGCHSMQNSIPVEFGFGNYFGTVDVEVLWPSGVVQKIEDVILNKLLEIEETTMAPDLSFINVKVLESHPIQGDTITIEANVVNMGYLDAEAAVVRFYDDDPLDGTEIGSAQEIINLEKFHSIKVTTTWDTTDQAGAHDLWAVIDEVEPEELIITNNSMNCSILIREKNEEPKAVLTTSPIESLFPGDLVFFDGSNSTDDIAVEYYYFDFGDGNSTDWIINSNLKHQYSVAGSFKATLKVKDSDGSESTNLAQASIIISEPPQPNRPPVIDNFTANPTVLQPGETSKLKIVAHDPDDDQLIFYFNADEGELTSKDYKSTATWHAPEEEGIYPLTAKVGDGELFSSASTQYISVITESVNHPPEIINIIIDPPQVSPGDNVTLEVTASDPDENDNLNYFYKASIGQIMGTGSKVTWQAPEIPGTYIIQVIISDQDGLSAEQEVTVIVNAINYLPVIIDADAKPNKINSDSSSIVLFTVEIEDKNGLDDIYRITIDLSPVGGKTRQKVYNNGKFGDKEKNDRIYSYEYIIAEGIEGGTKILKISVQDYSFNEITYDLELEVQSEKIKDDGTSTLLPGFGLHTLLIGFICYIFYFHTRIRSRRKLR